MSKAAVIDTNILLRIVTNDTPVTSKEALSWLSKFSKETVLLPESVLTEVMFVLESKHNYGFNREEISEAVRKILQMPQLSYSEDLMNRFVDIYNSTKLDVVDCMVLAYVKAGEAESLLSFDSELLNTLNR